MNSKILIFCCVIAVVLIPAIEAQVPQQCSNIIPAGMAPGGAHDVFVVGNYAYLCAGALMVILNVTNPQAPEELGRIPIPYSLSVGTAEERVQVVDNYAYVIGDAELAAIDISNPGSPREAGKYFMSGGYEHSANDVEVSGNYAYVTASYRASDNEPSIGRLWVIDISKPNALRKTGTCDLTESWWLEGIHVIGDRAYVAAGNPGLWIVDISDPEEPKGVKLYDTPGYAMDVYVVGKYAYVADGSNGLRVIDISNVESPREVGFCDTPNRAKRVYVADNHAYVADDYGGLRVINVSDPENPYEVSFCNVMRACGLHVANGYAYVACDEYHGLRIIDVSDPTNSHEVGAYHTSWVEEVHVVGDYAYVIEPRAGLRVIDISNPLIPRDRGYTHPNAKTKVCVQMKA